MVSARSFISLSSLTGKIAIQRITINGKFSIKSRIWSDVNLAAVLQNFYQIDVSTAITVRGRAFLQGAFDSTNERLNKALNTLLNLDGQVNSEDFSLWYENAKQKAASQVP